MTGTQAAGVAQPEDLAAVLHALGQAGRRIALYSDEHPLALEALHGALEALRPLFDRVGAAVLSVRDNALHFNDAPAPDSPLVSTLVAQLRRLHINRLTLSAELTPSSLAAVLRVLACDPESVFESGGPSAVIGEAAGVTVEEVSFRRFQAESGSKQLQVLLREQEASEGVQAVVSVCGPYLVDDSRLDAATEYRFEATDLLADDGADDPTSVGAVLAVLIQRAGAGAASSHHSEEWEHQMTVAASQLPLGVLASCLRSPIQEVPGQRDHLLEVGQRLPLDLAVAAVCHDPASVPTERSDRLRRLIARVTGQGERAHELYRRMVERLTAAGIGREAIEMSVGLVMKSHLAAEHIRHQVLALRSMQVERPSEVAPVYSALQKTWGGEDGLVASHRTVLLELLHTEFRLAQYTELLELLTAESQAAALQGDVKALVGILEALVEERRRRAGVAGYEVVVDHALREVMTPAATAGLEKALRDGAAPQVAELLAQLKATGLAVLARLLDSPDARPEIVTALARQGDAGAQHLAESLPRVPAAEAQVLLKALKFLSGNDLRRTASAFFRHTDAGIRLRVLEIVAQRGDNQPVEDLVTQAVDDRERSVQAAAVDLSGKRRHGSAVPALLRLVEAGKPEELAESARRALLAIRTPAVVAGLHAWLKQTGGWFRWGVERRRALAAELLLEVGDTEARAVLREFRSDRNAAVRASALLASSGGTGTVTHA